MMIARILILAALLIAPGVGPAFSAPEPRAPAFTEAQKADLTRVSDYLNSIRTAQGRFVQISADGRSLSGTLYLRKPGRLRFEYDTPNPTLVVSDGSTIAVSNTKLKTTDRYPLVDSPLRILLSDKIDLAADARVSGTRRETGTLVVTARQPSGPAQGEITLFFADAGSSLELRQWEVVDAQNLRTLVALSGLRTGVELAPRLFVIQELDPFKRPGAGRP
jgi:outer membrane lipoprotein-sorting protein